MDNARVSRPFALFGKKIPTYIPVASAAAMLVLLFANYLTFPLINSAFASLSDFLFGAGSSAAGFAGPDYGSKGFSLLNALRLFSEDMGQIPQASFIFALFLVFFVLTAASAVSLLAYIYMRLRGGAARIAGKVAFGLTGLASILMGASVLLTNFFVMNYMSSNGLLAQIEPPPTKPMIPLLALQWFFWIIPILAILNFLFAFSAKKVDKRGVQMFAMALPFIALVVAFSYLPLWGWRYAFFDYKGGFKLVNCSFTGWKWFAFMFTNNTQIQNTIRVLRNTFAISGLNILTSVVPVAFAVFLTEMRGKGFRRVVQTVTTLPHFIGWVLVYSMAFAIFSNMGALNHVLVSLRVIPSSINWLGSNRFIWLKMCAWSLWKNMGWNAIMYLAAIAGIDQELYEAAEVDGAGRFRKIWSITLPQLLPTFFVLLMLAIANFLNSGFDQYFMFQNAMNQPAIEVLDLYVYNIGIGSGLISLATVVSMFKSIVSLILLFSVNGLSRLLREESII